MIALSFWVYRARGLHPPPERRLSVRERHGWIAVYILIPGFLIGPAVAQVYHDGWPRLYSSAALTLFAVAGIRGAALALIFASALIRRRVLILRYRESEKSRMGLGR